MQTGFMLHCLPTLPHEGGNSLPDFNVDSKKLLPPSGSVNAFDVR